jgi:phosphatidylserine/phosphatidylglycerophosphate/cardiolipin synthase-like enzyme
MKSEKCKTLLTFALCALHFALFVPAALAEMAVQACFSPGRNCSSRIIREIGKAQKEILVALYAFTSDDLAWSLVKASRRGVEVRVVLDQAFDREFENSKGTFLEKQGLSVRRISGRARRNREGKGGLMHQKFAVIDRKVVLTGSYNWTASAEDFNSENLLLFRDAGPLAEEYRKEFFHLWERQR